MPVMEVDLNQVLKALEQLSPEELAVVQERVAAQQKAAKPQSAPSADVFALPFDDYLALPDEEREAVQLRVYQTHQAWIDAELERRGAEWLRDPRQYYATSEARRHAAESELRSLNERHAQWLREQYRR